METLRVIVADDHTLVRAGLRSLLDALPGVEVVAEAANGREAVALAGEHAPDLVLLDIGMPELNGLQATEQIRRNHPGIRVIVFSVMVTEEYVAQALRAGASGYLLKDAEPMELGLAIRAVMRGATYLSPAASRHAAELAMRGGNPSSPLTSRQREVLQLVAEGFTTKEIAQKLNLSIRTVETHRSQIMDRLGVRDVAGLVRQAMRLGLISHE